MNKIIAMAVLTVLVNPSLYGMKRAHNRELQEQPCVRSKIGEMSDRDFRMMILCRFETQKHPTMQQLSPTERDQIRSEFINRGIIREDYNGMLLQEFYVSQLQ